MVIQALFCVSVLANLLSFIYSSYKQGCSYLKRCSTWLLLAQILASVAVIVIFVFRTVAIVDAMETLRNSPQTYFSLDRVTDADDAVTLLLALLLFFSILSTTSILDLNRHTALFSATLGHISRKLVSYAIVGIIIAIAFGTMSIVVFGPTLAQFLDLRAAMMTLTSMALRSSNVYGDLVSVDLVIGRFFYAAFMLAAFLVMTTLLVALINDGVERVKQRHSWFDEDLSSHLWNKIATALCISQATTAESDAVVSRKSFTHLSDLDLQAGRVLDKIYFEMDYFGR